jgi:acetyl esterase/lipase
VIGDDAKSFLFLGANSVVITVAYRLAPEHPYPAAINDALESLRWVCDSGAKQFNLDLDRVAIGGTSAGSNLSTVLCLKAIYELNIRICFQLLIVPVIDNTATIDGIWQQNRNAPWLTPTRMMWYRRMYIPNESDWTNWDASPHMAPEELLKQLPPTWIGISEQDMLAPEAHSFAKQLSSLQVPITVYEVKGGTHSILALCGVLSSGRRMMEEAARALKSAVG